MDSGVMQEGPRTQSLECCVGTMQQLLLHLRCIFDLRLHTLWRANDGEQPGIVRVWPSLSAEEGQGERQLGLEWDLEVNSHQGPS